MFKEIYAKMRLKWILEHFFRYLLHYLQQKPNRYIFVVFLIHLTVDFFLVISKQNRKKLSPPKKTKTVNSRTL